VPSKHIKIPEFKPQYHQKLKKKKKVLILAGGGGGQLRGRVSGQHMGGPG
jgi:hypothetical protein